MEKIVYDLNEIELTAKLVLKSIKTNVLCFFGNMGSGKTTLIREILRVLDFDEDSKSPSFDILREYYNPSNALTVYHFDFYRIESVYQALDLGFEEYLYSNNLILIEWPGKIEAILPYPRTEIFINPTGAITRQLSINNLFE